MNHFCPVIKLPKNYLVLDLSQGPDPRSKPEMWTIGRYNEKRSGMYLAEIFKGKTLEENRDIHMGIDIGCPIETEIFSFSDGEVFLFANNTEPGSYGYTLITKHIFNNKELYALYGHLSKKSIHAKMIGQKIKKGEVIAWVGGENENGGWPPHLHFQLSYEKPKVCDMPGVVSQSQLTEALKIYPDPRIVLGPIY